MEDYKTFLMDVIDYYDSKNEKKIKFRQEGHTRTKDGTDEFLLTLTTPSGEVFKSSYIGTNGLVYAMQEAYKMLLCNLLGYAFYSRLETKTPHKLI